MNRVDERLKRRDYADLNERIAYRRGYDDGFNHREADKEYADEWPNAYNAGYWDGHGDNLK
jgi:hypothetical protein